MRGSRPVLLKQQSGRSQEIGEKNWLVTLLLGKSNGRSQEIGEKSRSLTLLQGKFNVKQNKTELINRRELGQRERKTRKESC
jgi:hypothetical protein